MKSQAKLRENTMFRNSRFSPKTTSQQLFGRISKWVLHGWASIVVNMWIGIWQSAVFQRQILIDSVSIPPVVLEVIESSSAINCGDLSMLNQFANQSHQVSWCVLKILHAVGLAKVTNSLLLLQTSLYSVISLELFQLFVIPCTTSLLTPAMFSLLAQGSLDSMLSWLYWLP